MSPSAVIAANRFGLGARPGELRAIAADPQAWLLDQTHGAADLPAGLRSLPDSEAIGARYAELQRARRAARRAGTGRRVKPEALPKELIAPIYRVQAAARTRAAIESRRSFHERLVQFWSNHFAVSADKLPAMAYAGAMENEAIRPHVNGYFVDMLLAVEQHPAMLVYLDNQLSFGPNSKLARIPAVRRRRKVDINENLAREILELHTMGVAGGYRQEDIVALAEVLTGWSVGGGEGPFAAGTPGRFEFRDRVHEPGAKTILGRRYGEAGLNEGRSVLRDLADHPATAAHIAEKLARHFVADRPPPRLVGSLARVFRESAGHLPSVYAALIYHPLAWDPTPRKFKTPNDFISSAFRALGYAPDDDILLGATHELGQPVYIPGSPAGWPDSAATWDAGDALLRRIEFASAVGRRAGRRIDAAAIAVQALGPALDPHTVEAMNDSNQSAGQPLTLLLSSPEFQRR